MGIDHLRIRVPATSANLGAGFDVFGIALEDPFDIIEVKKSWKVQIKVTGRDSEYVPADPQKNTAGIVASKLNKPVKITIHRGIPLSSGLGSSAAPAAGVAFALNEMYDLGLSREELVQIAAEGEKIASGAVHADNVAPAIYGGFVIVHKNRIIPLMPENIGIVAVHPEIIVSTRKARAILPGRISLDDLSYNIGSASSMVVGMIRGDIGLIGESMENRVIEDRRSRLIKGYAQVRRDALKAGAAGVTISGSGPTMIAVCRMDERERIAKAMTQAFSENSTRSEAFITTIGRGAERLY
ncbi:homoserine kinase [Candidatus Methanoperedens nitroreducens]|uniref:Homoserine kinase n=1 Tax=Candidatus Methanoperedens nitratireducens TaxID=1392998 RepID=A0A062VAL4_9EURY|nr:homoserine kinase [Candidatus Methanoperedens nitroreducens]KCZ73538.1 homoserine kinase [Candidatus Methanoperedens nitroreducens]MDJ1422504.1 homoserine kinase [Candidatus Methanoperedens sp.]